MKFIDSKELIQRIKSYSYYKESDLISEKELEALMEQFGHDRFINRENGKWEK